MQILILLFASYLLADVMGDYWRIEHKQKQIRHGIDTAVVVAVYGLSAALIVYLGHAPWHAVLGFCVAFMGLRWVLHDLLLNIARGKPFDYLGSEQHSANTDKLLNRLAQRGIGQFAVKFATLAGCMLFAALLQLFINLFAL